MDKEFLINYEAREKDEIKKFGQKFAKGKIKCEDRYPPIHRFKLDKPYSKSIDGERIWNQIPLYGTTIITLKPTKKEIFEREGYFSNFHSACGNCLLFLCNEASRSSK